MEENSILLHIIVVGFHHKRGFQVEFCYPPLDETNGLSLPDEWSNLIYLALPDGVHCNDEDFVYFRLPSLSKDNTSVYGIACYRQVGVTAETRNNSEVTRNTIQKSVCILSTLPLYRFIKDKLDIITNEYFTSEHFNNYAGLTAAFLHLSEQLSRQNFDKDHYMIDLRVSDLLTLYKYKLLTIFKLMLLESKVIFFMLPIGRLVTTVMSFVSLFPGAFNVNYSSEELRKSFDMCDTDVQDLYMRSKAADPVDPDDPQSDPKSHGSENNASLSEKEDLMGKLSNHMSSVIDSVNFPSQSLQEDIECLDVNHAVKSLNDFKLFDSKYTYHPYLSVQYMESLNDQETGFIVGASNVLFLHRVNADCVIKENGTSLQIRNEKLISALRLTNADLRFIDCLLKQSEGVANKVTWIGSEEWLRGQMRLYLLSLLISVWNFDKNTLEDFNMEFVELFQKSHAYTKWCGIDHSSLKNVAFRHPSHGHLRPEDIRIRFSSMLNSTERGQVINKTLNETAKTVSETAGKFMDEAVVRTREKMATLSNIIRFKR